MPQLVGSDSGLQSLAAVCCRARSSQPDRQCPCTSGIDISGIWGQSKEAKNPLIALIRGSHLVLSVKSESSRQILDVTWIKQYRLLLCKPAWSGPTLLLWPAVFYIARATFKMFKCRLEIMLWEDSDIIGCMEKILTYRFLPSPFPHLNHDKQTCPYCHHSPWYFWYADFPPQHSFSPPCPYTGWRGTSIGKGLAPWAAGSES